MSRAERMPCLEASGSGEFPAMTTYRVNQAGVDKVFCDWS